jgi:hypothetical protein
VDMMIDEPKKKVSHDYTSSKEVFWLVSQKRKIEKEIFLQKKKKAIYAFGPFDQNSEDRTTLFTPALHKGLKHNSVLPIFH